MDHGKKASHGLKDKAIRAAAQAKAEAEQAWAERKIKQERALRSLIDEWAKGTRIPIHEGLK